MIRVTMGVRARDYNDVIFRKSEIEISTENSFRIIPMWYIGKIEKQVKDLTKAEMYQYVTLTYGEFKVCNFEIYKYCIELTIQKDDGGFDTITLNDNDYIDVTSLYKEVE